MSHKRLSDAAAELQSATRLDPQNILYRVELAKVFVFQGKYSEAMAQSRIVTAMDPKSRQDHELGGAFFAAGRLDLAMEVINEYIKRNPDGDRDFALVANHDQWIAPEECLLLKRMAEDLK